MSFRQFHKALGYLVATPFYKSAAIRKSFSRDAFATIGFFIYWYWPIFIGCVSVGGANRSASVSTLSTNAINLTAGLSSILFPATRYQLVIYYIYVITPPIIHYSNYFVNTFVIIYVIFIDYFWFLIIIYVIEVIKCLKEEYKNCYLKKIWHNKI